MKRKPPKNQRAYKTPSGKKPRLTEVHSEECQYLLDHAGEVGVPHLYRVENFRGLFLADAKEMSKWRASQTTSTGEQS